MWNIYIYYPSYYYNSKNAIVKLVNISQALILHSVRLV